MFLSKYGVLMGNTLSQFGLAICDRIINWGWHRLLMNTCDTNARNSSRLKLLRPVAGFLVYFVLFVPTTAALASTEPSISEIQRLLNLTNPSLLSGDLDSSIGSLDEALNMIQELKAEGEGADNNNDDFSSGNDEYGIDANDDMGGDIVDDNVERSQRCVENAKPGEVCALS